jgi:hypothetical protein
VAARAAEIGLVLRGECESRLAGPKGNRERFLLFERPAAA